MNKVILSELSIVVLLFMQYVAIRIIYLPLPRVRNEDNYFSSLVEIMYQTKRYVLQMVKVCSVDGWYTICQKVIFIKREFSTTRAWYGMEWKTIFPYSIVAIFHSISIPY